MKKEILTDAVLREFLLGKVDDEEAARIESLFLTDSQAREKVLVIEQELIEDYLEDSLTAEDREKFLLRYGQTAAQLQQLRITKAIKDWAVRENASVQTVPTSVSSGGASSLQIMAETCVRNSDYSDSDDRDRLRCCLAEQPNETSRNRRGTCSTQHSSEVTRSPTTDGFNGTVPNCG
jgi:hypothetical protein